MQQEQPPYCYAVHKFYRNKYFLGMINVTGQPDKFLHFNKGRYELRKGLSKKAVVFTKGQEQYDKRYQTLKTSPFHSCEKVPCITYLYGVKDCNLLMYWIKFIYNQQTFLPRWK